MSTEKLPYTCRRCGVVGGPGELPSYISINTGNTTSGLWAHLEGAFCQPCWKIVNNRIVKILNSTPDEH